MTLFIEVDTSQIEAQFRKAAQGNAAISRAIGRGGLLLETAIKAHAPVDTGDYRRSWNTRLTNTPSGPIATVGTNKPQGRRLEFGFTGTDAIGRTYNQPPQPHVEPAILQSRPKIIAEIEKVIAIK